MASTIVRSAKKRTRAGSATSKPIASSNPFSRFGELEQLEQTSVDPEDLVIGVLAELLLQGTTKLRINSPAFHDAFSSALKELAKDPDEVGKAARRFYRDSVTGNYPALDHALTAAQRHGMIRTYNPTFNRIEICLTEKKAESLLATFPKYSQTYRRAAKALRRKIMSNPAW